MKKILISIIISTIITFQYSFAWIWLIAEVWDILTTTKWNEMINVLETKIDTIINSWSWIWIFISKTGTTAYFKTITGWNHISLTESNNTISINFTWALESSPIPYMTNESPIAVPINSTIDINIYWLNFIPNTTISIPWFPWTINWVSPLAPNYLTANITTPTTTGIYDIVISNNWVLNTLWTGNWIWMLEVYDPTQIDIDIVYNIAANAATKDDAATQLINNWLLLAARPITNNVAEALNVRNIPWDQLVDWEISSQYQLTTVQEFYILYYLNDTFQFVARVWKNDWTTTTLDEFTDTVATLYDYQIRYWNNYYTWTVNFNFASSSARSWTDWTTFSPDDWVWWLANWDLDWDAPGPYLYDYTTWSWWFWNMNSTDASATDLYIDWTANNWTISALVFIKQP